MEGLQANVPISWSKVVEKFGTQFDWFEMELVLRYPKEAQCKRMATHSDALID